MAVYYSHRTVLVALVLILDPAFGLHCYDYQGTDLYCSKMCCFDPDKGDDLRCCDDDTYDVRSRVAFSLTFVFIAVFIAMVILAFCGLKAKKSVPNFVPTTGYGNPTVVAYRSDSQQVQLGYPQQMAVNQPQPVYNLPPYPGYQ